MVPRATWRAVGELAALTAVLGLVFAIAYVPHLATFEQPPDTDGPGLARLADAWSSYARGEREGYRYPVHVDENRHWVQIAGVQRHDEAIIQYPTGAPVERTSLSALRNLVHERGYHVVMAEAVELTGVSFLRVYQILPAVWTAFTAFALYAALRPEPSALPAAAFVGLVPTTVRFLGPGFLVPIGFGLAWLPAVVILAGPAKRSFGAAALLLIVVAWSFFIHLVIGFAAVALLGLMALFSGVGQRRAAIKLLIAALAPVILLYQAFREAVLEEVTRSEVLPLDFTVFDGFGITTLFLWAVGASLLVLWPPTRRRPEVAALTTFSVLALASIVGSAALGLDLYATYARWHPPFFLAATVPAAYAVVFAWRGVRAAVAAGLRHAGNVPQRTRERAALAVGLIVAIALTGSAASQGVAHHVDQAYYRVIDDADWDRFVWVSEHAGDDHEALLAHPWKAPVLAAMTGLRPHVFLQPGHPAVRGELYDAYLRDTLTPEVLERAGVTLIVDPHPPAFEGYDEVHPGVWARST